MKKYLAFALAAIGMMAACTKEGPVAPDFKAPEEPGRPDEIVRFGTNVFQVATKGSGSLDEWKAQPLYVYSFIRAAEHDYSTETPYIDNVEGVAPSTGSKGELILYNPAVTDKNEPFYYKASDTYDFYGYYMDDAMLPESTVQKEASRIFIPFEINGYQDLMVAKADQVKDVEGTEVLPERAYSNYAARRNVHPDLVFKHKLARFTFEILAAEEDTANIEVVSLSLVSKYKGNLNVVGDQLGLADVDPQTKEMFLGQRGENGTIVPLASVKPTVEARKIGESLMVIPGETSYQMVLQMKQKGVSVPIDPQAWTLDASKLNIESTQFEAGKSYKIRIKLYGLKEIEITATLEPWVDGGTIDIDPDLM